MADEITDYQRGFEAGLKLGLATAFCVLRDGGDINDIASLRDEMKEVEVRRRNHGIVPGRAGVEGDIFLSTPIGHPADIGLPAAPSDDVIAAASRIRTLPKLQQPVIEGGKADAA